MMIPETSAPFIPSETGPASDADIKRNWWEQMLGSDVRNQMGRMKMITQFEEDKADAGELFREWRVTGSQSVLDAFLGVLNSVRGEITYASDFSVDCGGNWIRR